MIVSGLVYEKLREWARVMDLCGQHRGSFTCGMIVECVYIDSNYTML